jgi:CheY-like chemotaxis protein
LDHTAHVPPTALVRADRILVVDADADTRQVIREALITAGYEVNEAVLTGMAVLVAHRLGPAKPRTAVLAMSATRDDAAANPSSSHSSSVTHAALTSYDSRRRGEYVYNIDIYESARAATADHFRAHVMNMVLLEGGQTVSVNPDLQDEYGPTPQRALSRIERAVDEWVKDHTPLH